MYRINVRGFRYAILTSDTLESVEYEKIVEVPGTMTIGITPVVATGDLFGDGVKKNSEQRLTGIDIAIENNKIPIKDRAAWLGNTYKDGILHEGANDAPPKMAIGFIIDLTSGHHEVMWILKCGASPIANNYQQKTESVNYSTDSFNIKAEFRVFDSVIRLFGDSSEEDLTDEEALAFLKTVPGTSGTVPPEEPETQESPEPPEPPEEQL